MNLFINSNQTRTPVDRLPIGTFQANTDLPCRDPGQSAVAPEVAENDPMGSSESTPCSGLLARMLTKVLSRIGDLPVRFILPNGEVILLVNRQPVGTIEIRDYRTVWALAMDPLFQFGEAYSKGKIEIHGDMEACLTAVYRAMKPNHNQAAGQRLLAGMRRPNANSLIGSKHNIHHHYDLGNDFYRLWLDEKLIYTCAYFARPSFTLEQAQVAKMDHVCRKLRLRPGMQVVEAGCGWGALAIHMAKHYGVNVRAFNISSEQIKWARQESRRAGLSDRIEFVKDDWRNIQGNYDTFVSVGMLEHVGLKNFELLGQVIRDCLNADGLGLIHTIGQNHPYPLNAWIERRIFPGAYPPTLQQMMRIFEPVDFSLLDVENLRLHYAETLHHWLRRFDDQVDEIRARFDERFVRMWRMYLAGSGAAFRSGYLQLFQVLFAPASSNCVPRGREDVYEMTNRRIGCVLKSYEPKFPSRNGWCDR